MFSHILCFRNSVLSLCLFASSASAESLEFLGGQSVGNNVWSWTYYSQQSYSSSLFSSLGPSFDITAISFVVSPQRHQFQPGNSWTMTIGAVPNAVEHMSDRINDNLPLTHANFFATESFTTDVIPDGSLVTFHGNFTYKPADGDLVWQIQSNGPIGGPSFNYGNGSDFGVYWFAFNSDVVLDGNHGYRGQGLETIITIPETSSFVLGSLVTLSVAGGYMVRRRRVRS